MLGFFVCLFVYLFRFLAVVFVVVGFFFNRNRQTGGHPGDCFAEGEHEVRYEYDGALGWHWTGGDTCVFRITVTG